MDCLSTLKPYVNLFYARFKVAHHTGYSPLKYYNLNLFNLFVTTLPKVTIAATLLNQSITLTRITTLQMPSPVLPRLSWKISNLFLGAIGMALATAITLKAHSLDDPDENNWYSQKISQGIVAIEFIADLVSAIAAINLIAVGQILAGSVVLALLAVQVLERSHYISADVSFALSCLGYLAGAVTAGTLIERAFCVSALALLCLGRYELNKLDFKTPQLNLKLVWYVQGMVLGYHHPDQALGFLEAVFMQGWEMRKLGFMLKALELVEGYWGKQHPKVRFFYDLTLQCYKKNLEKSTNADLNKFRNDDIYPKSIMLLEISSCKNECRNHAEALKLAEEACDTYLLLEQSKQEHPFYNDIQKIVQVCQKSLGETEDVKRLLGKIEKALQALPAKKD